MYMTKPMTKSQMEKYQRDCRIYEEYLTIMEAHKEFANLWKIAGVLAPKYGICQMAVRNSILRVEKFRKGEDIRVGKEINGVNVNEEINDMNEEYKRLKLDNKRLGELLELYKKRCEELEKELETLKKKQRGISEKRREAAMKRWDKR